MTALHRLLPGRNKPDVWIVLLLILSTSAAFSATATADFINFDDSEYVTDNPHVTKGATLENLSWAFTFNSAKWSANWHPLTWISLQVDASLWGVGPRGYHLTNLLLHTANCALLFLFLRRLTGARWRSALVAGLFALHPMHVESVAWVAERKDLLSTLFLIVTLWAYVLYVEQPRPVSYLLVIAAFALGLMAKPMLVTLPCVLLLLDYWPLKRIGWADPIQSTRKAGAKHRPSPPAPGERGWGEGRRQTLVEKLPLVALAAASCIVTWMAQKKGGAINRAEVLPLRLENALISYVTYLEKLLWPHGLAPFYPYPTALFPVWEVVGAALLLGGISLIAFWWRKQRPYVAVGWLWFLGTLVPVIGIVQVGGQAMADRYTYVPYIGLFLIAAWGLGDLVSRRPGWKAAATLVAVGILGACGLDTVLQVAVWHDSESLWKHTLDVTSGNFMAYNNLGSIYYRRKEWNAAYENFTKAVDARPTAAISYLNLGVWYSGQKQPENAIRLYQQALDLDPQYVGAHENLGEILFSQGKVDQALDHFREAVRLGPESVTALNGLGKSLLQLGRAAEAHPYLEEALRLQPENVKTLVHLGSAFSLQGRYREAAEHFRTALRLEPRNVEALTDLGICYKNKGNFTEAIRYYTEALRIDPQQADVHYELGHTLAGQGKPTEAIVHYEEAVHLRKGFAVAYLNLGIAYYQAGNATLAVRNLEEAVRLQPSLAWGHYQLGLIHSFQGEKAEALACFQRAVQWQPNMGKFYIDLAYALQEAGRAQEARDAYRKGLTLDPQWPTAANRAAWTMATHPEARSRNGPLALYLARQLWEVTEHRQPEYLDTLAAALAETGQFPEAQATARQAIALLSKDDPTRATPIRARLALYERRLPFRSEATQPSS